MRSAADLAALPFTLKDDLRAAQDAASDDQPFGENQAAAQADIVQAISSSGTTGRPLYYALTARDVETIGDAVANVWFTAGIRRDDVVAHLVGLPMVAGGLPYADGFRRIGATLCWLGGFPTERILREMRHLRVTALLATTSFALYLSEQWDAVGRETGIASRLRKVIGGGEPGLGQPELRRRIVDGLALTHLRETMGLGDVIPSMWGECEVEDGMHFNAQRHVMLELIDPETGQALPWREGATGEIVYTAFDRDATPVVRYRSRDHAAVVAMGCACGRTGPRIRCIGRTDDMLIYKGMNVFPTAIRDLVVARFAGRIEPMLRLVEDAPRPGAVRPADRGRRRGFGGARRRGAHGVGARDRGRRPQPAPGADRRHGAGARRSAARRLQERDRGGARGLSGLRDPTSRSGRRIRRQHRAAAVPALGDPGHRLGRLRQREGAQRELQPAVGQARQQLRRRGPRLGLAAQHVERQQAQVALHQLGEIELDGAAGGVADQHRAAAGHEPGEAGRRAAGRRRRRSAGRTRAWRCCLHRDGCARHRRRAAHRRRCRHRPPRQRAPRPRARAAPRSSRPRRSRR